MNKKGFTLVELLAVILILAVLIGISSVSYIKIRDNTLEAEYKNVVTYLEGKAIEYANDTNITTISVEDLITSGYVKADDEIAIYDPRNNTSMNCYIIESTLKDDKYEAKLGDNLVDGDKCGKYTKTSEYQICEIKDGSCTDADFGDWIKTQETITLGVSKGGELLGEGYTFKWSSTTGFNSTESTITLKDLKDKVYVGTYKVEVKKDNELGTSTARIRIDNEKPSIISVDYPEKNWSQEKTVTVKATDNEGSGIESVYLSTNADCSEVTDYTSDNNELIAKVKENNITYYTCAEDKAHNISNINDKNKIEIKNIDRTAPTIEVKEKNLVYPITSNYDLLDNITVNNEEGGSPIVLTVAKINGEVIKNINTLPVGEYDVVYEVEDRAGNKVTNDEVHLSIFVPKFDLEYTGKEETYEIPATGKYELKLYGAQGANNGGKGAYLLGSINLQKGDKLIVNVGGQNGYNGGGVGPSGTYNGGGATTIKLNGNYIIRAAGGGGGINGTAGGSGNGAGGTSVGSGDGGSGTNSGGGSSSPSHQYSCNCDTCGGACIKRDPANCCPAGTTLCFVGVCYDDEHDIALGSSVCEATPCRGGGCVSYAPTYSCNCKTCTSAGNPGKGGANYWNSSLIKSITKNDGMNSGNGSAHITWEDKK